MDALLQLLTDFRCIGYQYECVLRHEVMLAKRISMHDGLGHLRLQHLSVTTCKAHMLASAKGLDLLRQVLDGIRSSG